MGRLDMDQVLNHMWEVRVSNPYPVISQPTGGRRKFKQQIKSHLKLVNYCFILAQFQIKRDYFFLVYSTFIQFCKHN